MRGSRRSSWSCSANAITWEEKSCTSHNISHPQNNRTQCNRSQHRKILFKDIVEGDDVRRLYCVQLVLKGNYLKSKCEKGAIKKAVHQEHLTFEMKWRFNHWRILGASFVSNGSSLPITLMRARNSQKKYLYAHLFQTCLTTSLIYDQLSIISGIMMGFYNSLGGFKYFLFQIQT